MANEKITMLKLKRLLQLLDTGSSMNTICSELHMSKRTVHNYKQLAEQSGIPVPILRQMEDAKLQDLLQPILVSKRTEYKTRRYKALNLYSNGKTETKISQLQDECCNGVATR